VEGFFIGEFAHALDQKGRLAVPAKFRPRFKEGAVVTRWLERSLAVFPRARFAELQERVSRLPISDRRAREFSRFLMSGAHEDEPDAQGRIGIPLHLRQHAGIRDESIVVGANDHLEIWAPDAWRTYIQHTESSIEEHLENLGI
jgi:MraZ protein